MMEIVLKIQKKNGQKWLTSGQKSCGLLLMTQIVVLVGNSISRSGSEVRVRKSVKFGITGSM